MARGLLSVVFRFGFIALPVLIATLFTIHNPDTLKQSLAQSGIYDNTGAETLQIAQNHAPRDAGNILGDADIQQVVLQAFSPQVIQTASEQVIDDTYGWLDGNRNTPETQLDLSQARNSLQDGLQQYAATRLAGLQPCSFLQLRQMTATPQNVLSLPCIPPGLDYQQAGNELVAEVTQNVDFLQNPTIDVTPLRSITGATADQEIARHIPTLHQLLPIVTVLVTIATAFCLVAYVAIANQKRRAQKTIALSLISTSILLGIGLLLWLAIGTNNIDQAQIGATAPFQSSVQSVISILTERFMRIIMLFAGVYLAVGAVWWLFTRKIPPRKVEKSNR